MKIYNLKIYLKVITALILTAVLSNCTFYDYKTSNTATLADYIHDEEIANSSANANIVVPIKMGIIVVPERKTQESYNYSSNLYNLSESEKSALMSRITSKFKTYSYIQSIEQIPSLYLAKNSGFDSLMHIGNSFDVDVIAVVSYDQVRRNTNNELAITYWSLLGAYIFEGDTNDTNTFIDVAVFHIPSKRMLFRATGTNNVQGTSTMIYAPSAMLQKSREGYALAADNLVANLDSELNSFKNTLRSKQDNYSVQFKPGYNGAGAFDLTDLTLMILIIFPTIFLWKKDEKK